MRKLFVSLFLMVGLVSTPSLALDFKWDPKEAMPNDIVVGDVNAPITVVEYASLTCPHCAGFHQKSMPVFKEKLLDTGKAKLIFRHLPLDQSALAGAIAVSCAPEKIRFEIVGLLYEEVPVWASDLNKMMPILEAQFGDQIDSEKMLECAKSEELSNQIVNGMQSAINRGVKSTPTFYINNEVYSGNISPEDFILLVEYAK